MSEPGPSREKRLFHIYALIDVVLGLVALIFLGQSIEHSSNNLIRASAEDETRLTICVIIALLPWVVHFIAKWVLEAVRRPKP